MRFRRNRPARCASTTFSCSSCTLNKPLGNFSRTVPVTSMLSSLLIQSLESRLRAGQHPLDTRPARFAFSARDHLHVRGLQTFRAPSHFELNASAFIQRFVSVRLNRRKMHEHILTRFALDESEAFRRVKPLHCTL